MTIAATQHAKDYGPNLEDAGFEAIYTSQAGTDVPTTYRPEVGDVIVFQPHSKQDPKDGHMEIYTSTGYVSDFKQASFWPSNAAASPWKKEKPSFTIYRYS